MLRILLSPKAVAPLLQMLLMQPGHCSLRAASKHDKKEEWCCLSASGSKGNEGTRDLHMQVGGLTLPSTYSGAVSLSMRSG